MRWRPQRAAARARAMAEAERDALMAEDVQALFRALLGRDADDAEVEARLDAGMSGVHLQRELLICDEHRRQRAADEVRVAAPPRVNAWSDGLARWTHQPGTTSQDEVAVVGHDGFCFIRGGSNAMLDQFLGGYELSGSWLQDWRDLEARRLEDAAALGVGLGLLVVPDKLALYTDRFPGSLQPTGPRPIEQLLAAGLGLVYPLDELEACRRNGEEVYLRTDSHLSLAGNVVLHDAACRALGLDCLPDPLANVREDSYLASGDLGSRFEPKIVEVMPSAGEHAAQLAEDNRPLIVAGGGQIGTRRVWRNSGAPRSETVVLFGDSYGFGDAAYMGLSFLLAQTFSEVHFVWVPFGWDGEYVEAVRADLVLLQMAERFAVRVPQAFVDVRAIELAAVRRDSRIDPGAGLPR